MSKRRLARSVHQDGDGNISVLPSYFIGEEERKGLNWNTGTGVSL